MKSILFALALFSTAAFANLPPVADFTYYEIEPGTYQFDARSSYDPDGRIVRYWWNFGDYTQTYGVNPRHTYMPGRSYRVTLYVFDEQNDYDVKPDVWITVPYYIAADYSLGPKIRGVYELSITWDYVTTPTVYIFRGDGELVAETANDHEHSFNVKKKDNGTTYLVCNTYPAQAMTCSEPVEIFIP